MSDDKDAKTEQPTGKRLGKAKSEGNIPISQEVKSAAMLLGGLIVVGVLSPWLGHNMLIFLRAFKLGGRVIAHGGRQIHERKILAVRAVDEC